MNYKINKMKINHYNELYRLWKNDNNIGLSVSDEKNNIKYFLRRNKNLNFVAINEESEIIGTILCGHDGRRGYLYHVYVKKEYRKLGIAKALIEICLKNLKKIGIQKCHLFVFDNNAEGKNFWSNIEFKKRDDIVVFSKNF